MEKKELLFILHLCILKPAHVLQHHVYGASCISLLGREGSSDIAVGLSGAASDDKE